MIYRLEILIIAIIVIAIGYIIHNYPIVPEIGSLLGSIVMIIGGVVFIIWIIYLVSDVIKGSKKG